MSYTEIYAFEKDGNACFYSEVRNAWRGAMAIWRTLEEKYLLSLPFPSGWSLVNRDRNYYSRTTATITDADAMKEIWDLAKDERLSENERIVLKTTFDYVVVKKEDLPKVIDAFNDFEGETSLKEQAEILVKMFNDDDVIAVGWNQTSVNGDTWGNFGGYDEEKYEDIPYNILTMDKHWFLFD